MAESDDMLDWVLIEGLSVSTLIGIDSDELHDKQTVRLDIAVGCTHLAACRTDKVVDTVDYGALRQTVLGIAQTHQVRLLEAFAELVAQTILRDFNAAQVRIKVGKPAKFADAELVGIELRRFRPAQQA